jgi:hypothetical protein
LGQKRQFGTEKRQFGTKERHFGTIQIWDKKRQFGTKKDNLVQKNLCPNQIIKPR